MKAFELNDLPEQMYCGKLTEKQLVEKICRFVIHNYPVFGLHKYDEDFRQDVILMFIEKSHRILHHFNPDFGDFFTFLYCYICTIINTLIKKRLLQTMRDKINIEECILELDQKEEKYHRIDFNTFELPKAPFAPPKIPAAELQKTFKELTLKHKDKKIIALALKSSYYLTDEQIQRICSISGIKKDYFYKLIQNCKESLDTKSDRRERAEERRNFAYYHHKRYKILAENLEDEVLPRNMELRKEKYTHMEKKHRQNWKRLNDAFEKGHIYLRPTNRTIASLMGICERQVNYYINCAKKELNKDNPEKT